MLWEWAFQKKKERERESDGTSARKSAEPVVVFLRSPVDNATLKGYVTVVASREDNLAISSLSTLANVSNKKTQNASTQRAFVSSVLYFLLSMRKRPQ